MVREFFGWCFAMFYLWRKAFSLRLAIRLADMKQRAFNRRYYIMLLEFGGREKLVSVCRDDINRFKRKKWLPKDYSHLKASEDCFYMTDLSRNNTLSVEMREKAMRRYMRYAQKNM